MTEPLISVITVCYNAAATLEDTIRSVVNQTYPNIEYIVVDGASTDRSMDIINKYSHRISTIISEQDKGIYDAMNKGIAKASGQYILFLNAGDCFTSTHTLHGIARCVDGRNAEIYFGKIVWVDTTHHHIHTTNHSHIQFQSQLYYENFPHPATIYNRDVFRKYGLFNLTYKVYADYEWNLRALVEHHAPFYYFDNLVTTFYTGGISNNIQDKEFKTQEYDSILLQYFRNTPKQPMINGLTLHKKIYNKIYQKRLNKIY